jgi:hypothetical protein
LSLDRVTIDGVWIGNRIYWTLWISAWLHFTIHYNTHTSVHSHVFTICCLVAASNCGHPPSSGFPKYPRPQLPALTATAHKTEPQQFCNWPTDWLTNSVTHKPVHSPTNSTDWTHSSLTVLRITSRYIHTYIHTHTYIQTAYQNPLLLNQRGWKHVCQNLKIEFLLIITICLFSCIWN